jgi:hypothetical protein
MRKIVAKQGSTLKLFVRRPGYPPTLWSELYYPEHAADILAGTGFITEGLIRETIRVIAVDPLEAKLEVRIN